MPASKPSKLLVSANTHGEQHATKLDKDVDIATISAVRNNHVGTT